jgi:hypothetical protein
MLFPSQNLVVIRMGNAATTAALALSAYDNVLWEKISDLTCSVSLTENKKEQLNIYPNPANKTVFLEGIDFTKNKTIVVIDLLGKESKLNLTSLQNNKAQIDISNLPKGIYFLQIDYIILIID